MANNQFSLKNASMEPSWLAPVGTGQPDDRSTAVASPANAGLSSISFILALNTASVDIRLLTTAIDSLKLTLSSQRPLQLASSGSAKAEASGAKATDKAAGGLQAPDLFKSAMAMDAALADLGRVVSLPGNEREELAQDNYRMASYPGIAAGGTTAVDLAKLEYAAAKAGIENDKGASRRQTLAAFGGDAALMATAFKMPGKDAGDMLAGWRTSMKLDRNQALDLADATNHLGKLPGDAEAADIGVILQRHGAAATARGWPGAGGGADGGIAQHRHAKGRCRGRAERHRCRAGQGRTQVRGAASGLATVAHRPAEAGWGRWSDQGAGGAASARRVEPGALRVGRYPVRQRG
ncbi:phage tail tape measure protein, TP901 family [Pseudomonas chlororaphis subsp. aurantiaca]|nr:phage tail tape measure protein, TP901 family [Pseudomonas chlororaphis subsp. aurantiaca]